MSFLFRRRIPDADLSNPDFRGYLTKRSKHILQWRRRYFVLKGNKLYFLEDASEEPHGVIDLKDCVTVKSADEKINLKNCFEVATSNDTYYMYADTAKEKDEWIGHIGRAIVRSSAAFTNDDGYESQ
mmetsp:Transcript_7071/g.8144  ORF Transcript_7071/g.8144 Transcript_7071/m.8144 type:complete len:127 (+) Transcript_7071:303-683(+)|eukprot:CAMPEP_0184019512 /NCGR_PEP_ID=MMETSP0954-20121128/8794_1 /TAXON_ID=627963 /ORGANISM="Aplanochytrium sp, Strain PBS07" /LENGTH=126 /DNA_ID=CAMNT_0026301189 /DNA_START=327 /DNA_END=707 /DNA_ORIENTATION=-